RHLLRTIGNYYFISTPAILLQLLPYCLLLSLLHALGKLSTNREIIAVIQSGRGILRITLPLMIVSFFCTLLSLGLNYQWAPGFEKRQDEILAEAGGRQAAAASHVLYRNPENRRLWMIGSFPSAYHKGKPLLNVEVTTTGDNHILQSRLSASHARWDRTTHQWTFDNPVISRYVPGQAPVFEKSPGPLILDNWSETPWQLIKPGLSAVQLGVPDLSGWLQAHARHPSFADPSPYLTQWHYRWALPFPCLVTVLLATPLAIHFSRRAPGGDIFLAVVLCALLLLLSNIVLAIGEAGTLQPALAAWLPNIAFSLLGIHLFRRRISGQPFHHPLHKLLAHRT
ncbi:MAG: LptF/LptG family permease, partial [Verrucomicrobia bacterium]|nr:LptF/LptG family permease [Verrucomicrobiota bacterium]